MTVSLPGDKPRLPGGLLLAAGAIGVVTGAVPFSINAMRVVAGETWWRSSGLFGHGVESLGLSVEWGMLSSAMGLALGVLLVWAGVGFWRGRSSARTVAWAYVICALAVNGSDMPIFLFRAKPGRVRTLMLWSDGVALVIPLLLAAWLIATRRRRTAVTGGR